MTLGSVFEKQAGRQREGEGRAGLDRRCAEGRFDRDAQTHGSAAPAAPRPAAPVPSARARAAAARDTTPPPRPSQRRLPRRTRSSGSSSRSQPTTSYRLHVDSLRSLMGIARSSDRVFTTPRPRPPRDTTRRLAIPLERGATRRVRRRRARPPGHDDLSLQHRAGPVSQHRTDNERDEAGLAYRYRSARCRHESIRDDRCRRSACCSRAPSSHRCSRARRVRS